MPLQRWVRPVSECTFARVKVFLRLFALLQYSPCAAQPSSWNGGQENVEALLESTKIDVKQSRAILKRVIEILDVPPAPPYVPPTKG